MMALIDPVLLFNKAYDVARPYGDGCERGLTLGDLAKLLDSMPEVEPERKVGKWIQKDLKWECDQCGCRIRRAKPFSGNMWNYYYCPNCGVKMEEGD